LYGWILYPIGHVSLSSVLSLNILFSSLTVLLVLKIIRALSDDYLVHSCAVLVAGIHPEIIYWVGRVTRESYCLFLVTASILVLTKLCDSLKVRWLLCLFVLCVVISITRIQLLFIPAVGLGFLFCFKFLWSVKGWVL